MTEEEIFDQVDTDNHQILLKADAPAGKRLACRVWKTAIPQYRKGHLDILDALEKDERKCPGLYLGGNYRTGVAFGDCVQFGFQEAEKVSNFLATLKSSSPDPRSSADSLKQFATKEVVAVGP
jgi:protoporphyrinogen/coproporphyrinogen III oxidase